MSDNSKEEVIKYIKDLAEDATIIVCKKKEDIPVIFNTTGERLKTKKNWLIYLRNGLGLVATVWIAALELAPEWTPTLPHVVDFSYDRASSMIAQIDFSFPYHPPKDIHWIQFQGVDQSGNLNSDTTYQFPASGIDPRLLG